MTTQPLFDLQPTHNPHRWTLPVEPRITVGPPDKKFLFGGVGLASAITALEKTTGRPTVWATAQYLSFAMAPDIVDIDVIIPKAGNNVTQARVMGHVQEREIFTVNAAVGARDIDISDQWPAMPDAPPPEDCRPMPRFDPTGNDLHSQFDIRVAEGRYGPERTNAGRSDSGRAVFWGRPKNGEAFTSGSLAIIADYVPSGTGNALGRQAGANSLDNTIRIRKVVETEWICCEIQIDGIDNGFVHGRMLMFSQEGVLMASASQSGIVRLWD